MLTLGVMAHRCSILGPQNKSWVQTQWKVGEAFVSILPMSLTWGCQWLVKLGLLLCFPPKKKQNQLVIEQQLSTFEYLSFSSPICTLDDCTCTSFICMVTSCHKIVIMHTLVPFGILCNSLK